MTSKIDTVLKAITNRITRALPSKTFKNPKLNVNSTSPVLSSRSYPVEDPQCSTRIYSSINDITICPKWLGESQNNKPAEEERESSDTEFVCMKGDDGDVMFIDMIKKYDDPVRKLDPKDDPNRGVSNFTGQIKGMNVFVGNFTYVIDFMIVENISSIIDIRLSQVVLEKAFVELSSMTRDLSEGVVRVTNKTNEISYKIPHKIEPYNSLEDLEKMHTKSAYLRNEEDNKRGVEYVMSKILRNLYDFFIMENFGMILGQPVHTNDDVETIEFNRNEINFERHRCLLLGTDFCNAIYLHMHDKLLALVVDYFQWLALCFCSSWSGFEVVTFPSIFWGNPLMKTSIIFPEFDTTVGHKIANSWNLLT
nr:retrotransposon Orf1 [Tanacetum cinerariifolium]